MNTLLLILCAALLALCVYLAQGWWRERKETRGLRGKLCSAEIALRRVEYSTPSQPEEKQEEWQAYING